ncbi:hypothetical protein [Ferrithrix thermotolerans]|uniref:hypothetical protein n=1 Tax=Ferrithrix thermotolerans TaxID=209649 RepID=UPI0015C01479|nr:hypothetical protein [Ferrithrix thermotolerans]
MFDASDRTTIWGGANLYQLWHKRLQVLVSYLVFASAIAILTWVLLVTASYLLSLNRDVIENIPVSVVVGLGVAALMLLVSKWVSVVGFDFEPIGDAVLEARVKTVLEAICTQVGVQIPLLAEIKTPAIEVASFKKGGEPLVVLSSGALESLSVLELEAVLAREIAKVRSGLSDYDAYLSLPRRLLALVTLGAYPESVTLPMAQEIMLVDVASLSITRFPPALILVLKKIRDEGVFFELEGAAAKGSSWLWLNPPLLKGSKALLEDRIAQLEEW